MTAPVDTAGMTWEQLEAAGLDTCGLPLAECPGPPPCGPLTSWKAVQPVEFRFSTMGRAWTERAYNAHGYRAPSSSRMTDDEIHRTMAAISAAGGNRAAAARELGISAPTVYSRIRLAQERGIAVPASRPRGRWAQRPVAAVRQTA